MLRCRKILDREEEFVKLNEQLDLETQGLLQQLDHVMMLKEAADQPMPSKPSESTQQSLLQFPLVNTIENQMEVETKNMDDWSNTRQHFSASALDRDRNDRSQTILPVPSIGGSLAQVPKLTRHRSEVKIRERFDNGVIPETVKTMGQDGVLRFLKAKVQLLQEQLECVQKDEKKLIQKVKEFQTERERIAEDRDKWIQQANIAKNMLTKHETHSSNIVLQLQNTQAENGHLKRDIEKLKKELRQVTQNSGSNEVRLNRSIEEIERLKNTIRQMKQEDKEAREANKKKAEELTSALKKIEKQKIDLLHAFKKQFVVIDNLKKQRGLAEAGKHLKSIEEDFMEFLDWSPNEL